MSLITVYQLSKSFGATDIFSGLSFAIPGNVRIALVGPNGIGKTTLLRILMGIEEPSNGRVQRARHLRTGYLPQESDFISSHTLWEECLTAFEGLRASEEELRQLESDMSDPALAEGALARYGALQRDFEQAGGYTYETRIQQTLSGLGFESRDYHRSLTQLSGGERTRALLARLLLSRPNLLILDEPTNHLDIKAVEWLEGHLNRWKGAALIVSHDRYFLDQVVNQIWEMRSNSIEIFHGNYAAYLQQRQERSERQKELFLAEKERMEKEVDFIKRNLAGQLTTQAKGRLRRLSRQVEALDSLGIQAVKSQQWHQISQEADISEHMLAIEEVEQRVRSLRSPDEKVPSIKINLKTRLRGGDIVLRTKNLVVGYPSEPLISVGDLELRRGECVAIIGPNGAGKTTFLKTILGEVSPLAGEVTLGPSFQVGYFAQAHEGLHPLNTLVQEIESVVPKLLLAEIRNYLARFSFTNEDVFRQVSTLSGGERGRLALAKLSLSQANLLLLDEPTNHLDIPTQETLQDVLEQYGGSLLLVSHDRYLIDALGTQIWEIDPDKRTLRVFRGSYSEFRAKTEAEEAIKLASSQPRRMVKPRPLRTTQVKKRRQLERMKIVESNISNLEARQATLAIQLEKPPSDPQVVQKLGEEYMHLQAEIESLVNEWELLSALLGDGD